MTGPEQESGAPRGEDREPLDTIEDLEPAEAEKYELRGGKYYRKMR